MSMHRKILAPFIAICIAILACTLPEAKPPEPQTSGDSVPSPTFTFTPAPNTAFTSTPEPAPVQNCTPLVTVTSQAANVRGGPGLEYNILGTLPQGATAPVAGKNFDGSWWYIQFAGGPGGYGWIAGSVTAAACIPATLPVIAAPPIPPTNTPVPGAPPEPPSLTPTSSGGLWWFDPGILLFLPTSTPTTWILQINPDLLQPVVPFPGP